MTASKKYIACHHGYLCSQTYELMNYATSTLCNNNKEILNTSLFRYNQDSAVTCRMILYSYIILTYYIVY